MSKNWHLEVIMKSKSTNQRPRWLANDKSQARKYTCFSTLCMIWSWARNVTVQLSINIPWYFLLLEQLWQYDMLLYSEIISSWSYHSPWLNLQSLLWEIHGHFLTKLKKSLHINFCLVCLVQGYEWRSWTFNLTHQFYSDHT